MDDVQHARAWAVLARHGPGADDFHSRIVGGVAVGCSHGEISQFWRWE